MGDCQARHTAKASTQTWVLLVVAVVFAFALAVSLFVSAAYGAGVLNTQGYEFADSATNITYKVTTPASGTSIPGEVELASGQDCTASSLSVSTVSNSGYTYKVTAIKHSAFEGNTHLQSVAFASLLYQTPQAASSPSSNALWAARHSRTAPTSRV